MLTAANNYLTFPDLDVKDVSVMNIGIV